MYLVEVAARSPGHCRLCGGASDREFFMDMEMIEDFFGHVYYCNYCVDQMAKIAGYTRSDDRSMERLQEELDDLRKQINDFGNLFDGLLTCGIDLYGLLDFLDANRFEDPTAKRERAALRRAVKLAAREKELAGQTDERGSVDVPNPASNQLNLFA
jgi:alkylhydroperoxidase family enzyme